MSLIPFTVTVIDHVNNPNNTLANTDIEIRTTQSGEPLAQIYSDDAGLSPIPQPGAQTNSLGVFYFYAESEGGFDYVAISSGFRENINAVSHDKTTNRNPGDGSAHNAEDISNQNGGTLKDTADYNKLISSAEVIDYNYEIPYRKLSDYAKPEGTVFGIAHTGQSLAEGGVGGDPVSGVSTTAFPNRTLMFTPQTVGLNSNTLGNSTVGLTENSRVTIGHSLTRNLATGNENTYLFSGQAWGGQPYSTLKKGGSTGVYEKCITQVQNAKNIYSTIKYLSVTCIHGEQDGLNNNTSYSLNLNEWQTDFNADIKAITGQPEDIVMYLCQTSTAGGYNFNGGISELTFPTPVQQLKAHEDYPNIVMVAPKYFLPYYDHSHITNLGQRILGEYYAKAQAIGNSYSPLRPSSVVGAGSSVVVTFAGSVGNLSFDTSKVTAITNQGFAYQDDSGRTITDVSITGSNEVTISLSGTVGANAVLAYAYHNGSGGASNQANGLGDRGNLRDSNTTPSLYDPSYILHNWCVTFRKAVA